MSGNHNFKIIGVVGKTYKDEKTSCRQVLGLAKEVGEEITSYDHAVLTGGHINRIEFSVKYRALKGAHDCASSSAGKTARIIGIVPVHISGKLCVSVPGIQSCRIGNIRSVFFHTGLLSEDRNPITGSIADVLIALPGERGTAQEIAAALIANRPVVFLNSLNQKLKNLIIGELKKKKTNVLFPSQPCTATNAALAVQVAVKAANGQTIPPSTQTGIVPFRDLICSAIA